MHQTQLVGTLLAIAGIAAGSAAAIHALLHKRRPQSAFGWIAVCFTLPIVGAILYYLFGINRVRLRASKLPTAAPSAPQTTQFEATPPAGWERLERLGAAVTRLPLLRGNAVEVLHNGEQTFPAMLQAIRSARKRVFLSTYIFDSGPVGKEFVAALAAAARGGADVRVLLDGVGELYSFPPVRHALRREGVRLARFLPPRLVPPSFSVNLRNHRKILAVDGRIAFTGGINLRDQYLAEGDGKRIVDLHFSLRGPIVQQMEAVFLSDWWFVTGESDGAELIEPTLHGTASCRSVVDGPDHELDRLTALFTGAIAAARRRVAIMTPYFLPPRELVGALQAAALEGVDVAVILPAMNNLFFVHRATRHMLWELLQRGVAVYYQPPPFVHSKLLYIDDDYAQVGSTNLDPRSLRLNFEMNVEVYDRGLVGHLSRHFEQVRERSRRITIEEVDGRPIGTKIADGLAWLAAPYL
jgi:cardiolipin synthase